MSVKGAFGVLASLLALALMCKGAVNAAAPPPSSKLVIGQSLEPPGLDPTAGAAVAIKEVVFPTVFEGLVRLDAGGTISPRLATRWSLSADGRVYRFHLRQGVRFQDGAPFSSADVRFTLDRDRGLASTNAQKTRFALIERVDTPDPATVVITLRQRYADFLTLLAFGDAAILSPASAPQDRGHPVGTGPFKFDAWRRGELVSLMRNPSYWGPLPTISTLVFRFIGDPNAAYSALDAGDVDAFANFPAPETLTRLAKDPRFKVAVAPTEGKALMALNNRIAPLSDVRVRRALTMAINRQAVIDGAMYGYGRAIGSHYPPGDPGYLDLTGRYPYDPVKAKALLAEAGYPRGFAITLKLPPPFYARRAGEIITAQLAKVGVSCKIELLEWAPWLDQVFARHDFAMTIVNHAEPMDYDIYARPDYYFGYQSPPYKALYDRLEATQDPAARQKIIGQMQQTLADDAVNVFLFDYPALGVWSSKVSHIWAPTPIGQFDYAAATVEAGALRATSQGAGPAPLWLWAALLTPIAALFVWAAAKAGPRLLAARLGAMAVTLLIASLLVFLLLQIAPGDSARYMMGMNADEASLAALRKSLGLNGPLGLRYLHWALGALRGDLGQSYTYRVPVADLVIQRLSVSVPLTLYALGLSTLSAFLAGTLAALRPGRFFDRAFTLLTTLGVAIPNFWIGLVLVIIFASGLRLFAAGGFPGWNEGVLPALKALTLPAIALALPQAAILARVLRAELIPRMEEDYVRTARAKGLSKAAALWRHALPNALIPVFTILGLQFSFLLAGGIIVENVFFLPGLGRLLIQAITERDLITVQDVVVLLVFAATLVTLLTDLLYAAVDPRLRVKG